MQNLLLLCQQYLSTRPLRFLPFKNSFSSPKSTLYPFNSLYIYTSRYSSILPLIHPPMDPDLYSSFDSPTQGSTYLLFHLLTHPRIQTSTLPLIHLPTDLHFYSTMNSFANHLTSRPFIHHFAQPFVLQPIFSSFRKNAK